eukprot:351140-Chlamydomonas_euryale.AAC.28
MSGAGWLQRCRHVQRVWCCAGAAPAAAPAAPWRIGSGSSREQRQPWFVAEYNNRTHENASTRTNSDALPWPPSTALQQRTPWEEVDIDTTPQRGPGGMGEIMSGSGCEQEGVIGGGEEYERGSS